MKTSVNTGIAIAKTYENEFSKIGVTLLTRALLCAGLMAIIASGVAMLAGN